MKFLTPVSPSRCLDGTEIRSTLNVSAGGPATTENFRVNGLEGRNGRETTRRLLSLHREDSRRVYIRARASLMKNRRQIMKGVQGSIRKSMTSTVMFILDRISPHDLGRSKIGLPILMGPCPSTDWQMSLSCSFTLERRAVSSAPRDLT